MAHGKPDWNRTSGQVTTYQLDDLGEHAARLGAINTFDRRGDTVFQDDFEAAVLHWSAVLEGTGAAVALSTARTRSGNQSVRLTAGSDGNSAAQIQHVFPVPRSSRIGLEASFQIDVLLTFVEYELSLFDGTTRFRGIIRWIQSTGQLVYINSGAGTSEIATGLTLSTLATMFNTLKFVVDMALKQYVRVILNQTEYSLSGFALEELADTTSPLLRAVVKDDGRAANNDILFVDDVILTQNEP